MFHFSSEKMNTRCTVSVPCTEADSCCSHKDNSALALTMDAIVMASIFAMIICIIIGLRLTALVIISMVIISLIIIKPFSLGLKQRC